MNTKFESLIECQDLLHVAIRGIDERDIDRAVECFAIDGCVIRRGERADGSAAIRALFEDRPTNNLTRHHCTNFVFNWNGQGVASAKCYVLLFAGKRSEPSRPSMKPKALVDYEVEYGLTDEGWRITCLSASRVAML